MPAAQATAVTPITTPPPGVGTVEATVPVRTNRRPHRTRNLTGGAVKGIAGPVVSSDGKIVLMSMQARISSMSRSIFATSTLDAPTGPLAGRHQARMSALLVAEFVADAPDGQDHLRVLGVLFDLGTQAIDV